MYSHLKPHYAKPHPVKLRHDLQHSLHSGIVGSSAVYILRLSINQILKCWCYKYHIAKYYSYGFKESFEVEIFTGWASKMLTLWISVIRAWWNFWVLRFYSFHNHSRSIAKWESSESPRSLYDTEISENQRFSFLFLFILSEFFSVLLFWYISKLLKSWKNFSETTHI